MLRSVLAVKLVRIIFLLSKFGSFKKNSYLCTADLKISVLQISTLSQTGKGCFFLQKFYRCSTKTLKNSISN